MTPRLCNALSLCAATAIGLAVSTGRPAGLALAAGMPAVCLMAKSRGAAFESALSYYAAGLWPMIPGLQRYIGSSASPLVPLAIWLFAALLLSVPWTVAWTDRPMEYIWRVPLALVAMSIPPVGIVGLISPLTAAGYLFPSTGWVGLAAVVLLPGFLLSAPEMTSALRTVAFVVAIGTCGTLATIGRVAISAEALTVPGWVGMNTHFGDLSQPLRDYDAATFIQQTATESTAHVLIFPEFIVPRWSEATEVFWRQTLDRCRARGQTLLIGAGLPSAGRVNHVLRVYNFSASIDALENGNSSPGAIRDSVSLEAVDNTLLAVGASSGTLYERVPVPIGMWRPFSNVSVPLRLNGPGVIEIDVA